MIHVQEIQLSQTSCIYRSFLKVGGPASQTRHTPAQGVNPGQSMAMMGVDDIAIDETL